MILSRACSGPRDSLRQKTRRLLQRHLERVQAHHARIQRERALGGLDGGSSLDGSSLGGRSVGGCSVGGSSVGRVGGGEDRFGDGPPGEAERASDRVSRHGRIVREKLVPVK